jgi:2-hydroxychromene-2-carboxylate isomerase
MGDVIQLSERRAARARRRLRSPERVDQPTFFFDLASPLSYLAAERVERVLGEVRFVPAMLEPGDADMTATRAHAETLAIALRIPLIWPEGFPSSSPRAMRAAAHAASLGAATRFALAAGRLAFCGGFDIEDPEILAEAAAAAGIAPEHSLVAAEDLEYDAELRGAGARLSAVGIDRLPAICIDGDWLEGESAVAEAVALPSALRSAR